MVARGEKPRCQSPCCNVHVELDNRALKAKNNGLIQSVAKLKQENAELSKQINYLQGESFELKSRYNNLKNVISIIDSTTKTCLPKLTEVVETFTGIIQLCSVAANISNSNRDTVTQAVKPQIVNGHVLHNPIITLSRLGNDDASFTPPRPSTSRITSNIVIRPGTSRASNDANSDRSSNSNSSGEGDGDNENRNGNEPNGNMEEDNSFICQATRGLAKRKKSRVDMARLSEEDSEGSDEELEMPLAEEEENEEESDQRLTTIEEDVEEEEDLSSPVSPRSRQRRFLKGRLQEVKIYLNQLPTTYVEQFTGSGNISISVSPPERRSSYMQRTSSLVGEVNGTLEDNRRSFLDQNISLMSTVRMSNDKVKMEESSGSPLVRNKSKLSMSFKSLSPRKSSTFFQSSCGSSTDKSPSFSKTLSPIRTLPESTTPRSSSELSQMPSLTLQESTPILPRKSKEGLFNRSGSLNRSSKSENSLTFKTNVTKRRGPIRDQKKIAQVLLNRLSPENKLSGSPYGDFKDIVKLPLITKRSEMKTRSKGKSTAVSTSFKEQNAGNDAESSPRPSTRRKKGSSTEKVVKIKKEPLAKPVVKTSPRMHSMGRPLRAARPTTLKEPNLHKKMRRSK